VGRVKSNSLRSHYTHTHTQGGWEAGRSAAKKAKWEDTDRADLRSRMFYTVRALPQRGGKEKAGGESNPTLSVYTHTRTQEGDGGRGDAMRQTSVRRESEGGDNITVGSSASRHRGKTVGRVGSHHHMILRYFTSRTLPQRHFVPLWTVKSNSLRSHTEEGGGRQRGCDHR